MSRRYLPVQTSLNNRAREPTTRHTRADTAPAPPMSSKHDAKLVILGASGVGKTCLGLRFVKDQFVAYTASTIGASFLVKEVRSRMG